ncbi:MAG: hypothetical protein NTX15_11675, partial [Candidatus Kapabacteria bacterium]|nr:hypothetical protein [Candidatus Kapabacteria bacterium]
DTTSIDLHAELTLNIQGPSACSDLYFTGDTVLSLDNNHSMQRLSVAAMFYDGYQRYVELDQNTSFISRDTAVCIFKDGWVQMRGQGATTLITRRCGLSDSIRVECASSDLPPVADAGADTSIANVQPCAISALRSRDPEGSPLTYKWWVQASPPLVTATITEPTNPVTSISTSGKGLTVLGLDVADSTGKHDTAWKFIRVGATTSVQSEPQTSAEIDVYPNPSSDVVHILHPYAVLPNEVYVKDMLGTCSAVRCDQLSATHTTINVRLLPSGLYHVAISPSIHVRFIVVR